MSGRLAGGYIVSQLRKSLGPAASSSPPAKTPRRARTHVRPEGQAPRAEVVAVTAGIPKPVEPARDDNRARTWSAPR